MESRTQERVSHVMTLLTVWDCLDGLTNNERVRLRKDLEWIAEGSVQDFKTEILRIK